MQVQNPDIYIIILTGAVLALLLVGFIVVSLLLYQRKQHRQERQLVFLKDQYERELLRSQLEIQEATFRLIAQELHDNIGQVLSVVKLSLSILPLEKTHPAYTGVLNCREMLNKVIYDMADLTKSMHTDRIAEIGIPEAIRFELDIIRKNGIMDVDFSLEGTESPMEQQKAIFVFRIFQEMLNNILKHAKAKKVSVSINYSIDNIFVMQVKDDGVGFDLEKKQNQHSATAGLGLKSIMNRGRLIGAEIFVDSRPGEGTEIRIKLPLEHRNG